MLGYLLVLLLHAVVLAGIGFWYARDYRKAVRRSRRELERLVARNRYSALETEVEYLRQRNEVLMRGLFPRGDVFPGNFIEEDPELRALCELLELLRGQPLPDMVRRTA
jgi:hypothetical protein